jgi:catechol 2,3-dioxygenase-like lactoylglutathione lyase family enzyme
MLRTLGILHFTLGVRDIARSVAFYRDIVGLEVLKVNGDRMAFLRSGKDQLVLVRHDADNSDTPSALHQAFIVEPRDFAPSIAFLESNGVEILKIDDRDDPTATFSGRSAYFRDPDGNVLEIIDLRASTFRIPINETPAI